MQKTLLIAVGSLNPVKLDGVRKAAARAFAGKARVVGINADSRVHAQPVGFGQTWEGARNRARHAHQERPDADYAVGLESGLIRFGERHFDIQFCALYDGKTMSAGCSMGFPIPRKVEERVFAGSCDIPSREMGDVMSELSGIRDIGKKGGAIAYLSGGLLQRREMVEQAFLCALIERRSPV